MRTVLMLAAAVAASLPLALTAQADPDRNVKGGGLPAGWQARFDNAGATAQNVKFAPAGAGFRVTSGPAAIFYQPAKTIAAPGDFRVSFSQLKPSEHPEAYGLFIGGSDLQGPNQKYTYFLLRQDGMFLIKRRAGTATPTIMNWTRHAAIKPANVQGDARGVMTNELGVRLDQKAHFLINGTEVAVLPLTDVDARGVAGVRINHNLDVRFEFGPATK